MRLKLRGKHVARFAKRQQNGASMIEVLVTFLLLSFGLLALGNLQAFSIATTTSASNRGLASSMANELTEIIRANPTGFAAGAYDKAVSFNPLSSSVLEVASGDKCAYPNCTAATLALFDGKSFDTRLKATLKGGTYAIVRPVIGGNASTNQADVWVIWPEDQAFTDRSKGGGGNDTGSIEKAFDNCPDSLRNNLPLPRCYYLRVTL